MLRTPPLKIPQQEQRLYQLRVDAAGPGEGYSSVDEVLPLDDPDLWQGVEFGSTPTSELSAQGCEGEEFPESRRPEVDVEVVFGPRHAVPESISGH
jgi:hypothetical protein